MKSELYRYLYKQLDQCFNETGSLPGFDDWAELFQCDGFLELFPTYSTMTPEKLIRILLEEINK